jgi:hypothetical protein
MTRTAIFALCVSLLALSFTSAKGQDDLKKKKKEARDVVTKYFAAEDWSDRLPFVLDPDKVKPLMKARYKNAILAGMTIDITSVEEIEGKNSFFVHGLMGNVKSKLRFPFTQVVRETKDGFRIDWPASVGYNETPLKTLTVKHPDKSVNLRVECEIDTYFNFEYLNSKETHYSIKVMEQYPLSVAHGYILKSSEQGEKLFKILKDGNRHKLILEVEFVGPDGGRLARADRMFAIKRVVSRSWLDPE